MAERDFRASRPPPPMPGVRGRGIPAVVHNMTELIGQTPILRLRRLYDDTLYDDMRGVVYAKLENMNPTSSIKDRVVLNMVRRAMADGRIGPTTEVVEASSGNTAIALAALGVTMGFRVKVFMSEHATIERQRSLAAFGAKIVLTPAVEHTRGARERAMAYCAANPKTTLFLNQHGNPDNAHMHETVTGPELWEQLAGRIDAVILALGTAGTYAGIATYLKRMNPDVFVVGVEAAASPVYSGGKQGTHHILGMSPGLVTDNYKRCEIKPDEIMLCTDEAAYEWTRRIAYKEGILVGLTSGACAWAAGQLSERPEFATKAIVTFFFDTGERYLSVDDLYAKVEAEIMP